MGVFEENFSKECFKLPPNLGRHTLAYTLSFLATTENYWIHFSSKKRLINQWINRPNQDMLIFRNHFIRNIQSK